MAVIKLTEFHGLSPRTSELLLSDTSATVARNVKLRDKTLTPWKDPLQDASLSKLNMNIATVSTIFYYPGPDGNEDGVPDNEVWFHWPVDVDVAYGQHDDVAQRVYYAGTYIDWPKMTYSGICGTTGSQAPTSSYRLGVPAPDVLTANTPSGSSRGTEYEVTASWIYTWVTSKGEEGPPSIASNSITYDPGAQSVVLQGFLTSPGSLASPVSGNFSISKQRLYRLVTDASGSTSYNLFGERAVSANNWTDTGKEDSALGEVIPSTYWDMPDEDMIGLVALPNEFLAGFFDRTIAFSEPGYPHAWPTQYELKVDFDIVAIAVFGETVVIATEGNPYLCHGVHPSNMSLTKLEVDQACVSKRSMVDMGNFVVYASPDGLVQVGNSGAKLLTEKFFTKDEWQALWPSTIVGAKQDNMYVAAFNNGTRQGFIIDPDSVNPSFVYTDQHFIGRHTDILTDTLYLHEYQSQYVSKFDKGTNYTYVWRSKKFRFPNHRTVSCAQVFADSYPVIFRLYTDGGLRYTYSVPNSRAFRLPSGKRARDFQVEIEGNTTVEQVFLATKMEELHRV